VKDESEIVLLQEVHRLLKKEGLLILTLPTENLRLTTHHFRHYSVNRITELLLSNGFKILEIRGQGKPLYGSRKELRKFMKQFPLLWKIWRFSYRERKVEKASHMIIAGKPN